MKPILVTILFGSLLTVAACGKKKDKDESKSGGGAKNAAGQSLPAQGACDTREQNKLCTEYFGQPGGPTGMQPSQKSGCEANGGKPLDKCPTEGALGRCVSAEIRIQQVLMYPPMEQAHADAMCKGMGDGKLGPA